MSYVNSVTVYPSSATVTKGKWYYGAYASIASDCPECAEVRWYSNNSSIASVNASTGYIYGVNTGTTRIYAEATDGSGKKDYITVTVTAPVSVTGISVCPTSKSMDVGCTDYLYETIYPSNATNQTVTWCSSDDSVAEVNTYTGFVRAKKAGTATITATTADGGYSDSCEVTVFYDTVTIQKDGAFNKVVFQNSGKVWRCINRDMIFNDNDDGINSIWDKRSNHNFFTYYNESDPLMSNTTPKEYTDEEIKLLYAIDPHGVAYYIQRYVAELDITLEDKVKEKDRIFRLLFQREPKYFARTIDGTWYEVDDYEEINDVLSESETIFGMHQIYDARTWIELLQFASTIIGIAFGTTFIGGMLSAGINIIATVHVVALATDFNTVKNELSGYVSGTATGALIEKHFKDTLIHWANNYVSLYDSLQDLSDAMTLDLSYSKEVINYCACDTGYNVLFEMKNGMTYRLHDVCDLINQ